MAAVFFLACSPIWFGPLKAVETTLVQAEQPEPAKEKAASGALRKMSYGRKTAGVMKQTLQVACGIYW